MTELWIDGVAAMLPTKMSVTVKRENPLFTKNGEYTYELELELSNAVNAKLYEHLNRLNSVSEIKSKRKAMLIADNRVYCNGTEIITGWTAESVKIQIASGNSELNYFIGGDLSISFLKLGSAEIPTDSTGKLKHIEKSWPEVDYCLTPLMNQGSGEIINQWVPELYMDGGAVKKRLIANGETYTAQPYLCFIINKICESIGYQLDSNAIENTEYSHLYLAHAEDTTAYADMFPGWSIKELFEEIEKLFNVSFIIDNKNRTVRILFNVSFFTGAKTVNVKNVVDDYEAEVEEEEESTHTDSTIKYELQELDSYALFRLKEGVMKKAKQKVFDNYMEVEKYLLDTTKADIGWVIGIDKQTAREYIAVKPENQRWQTREVNLLKDLKREESSSEIIIKMAPVSFMMWMAQEVNSTGGSTITNSQSYYLPYVLSSDVAVNTEETGSLEELIHKGGAEEEKTGQRVLTIAFYQGLWSEWMSPAFGIKFPCSFIDCDGGEAYGVQGGTLRLSVLSKKYYEGSYQIDTKNPISITSYDPNLYDAINIFEIKNKRYVCRHTEYTLTASGRKKEWTGIFYPIFISDTEADKRWILTDGKWRDGGAWMDNGRWLDE